MKLTCFVWEESEGQVLWVQERNQNHSEPWVPLSAYLSLQVMGQTYCTEEKVEICYQPL
jgi:hypothetical protein